tara:strand:+ start:282 stop:497 length:216 start_codon:yes stop_codon:yes gene_type:complete
MDKERAFQLIEQRRMKLGMSVNKAGHSGAVSQSEWQRFVTGEREPTWDKLMSMAETVDLSIQVTIEHPKED